MKTLAIILGKITLFLGKLLHRGSSLPGKIALKIDKNLLKKFTYPKIKICVTGSSGKGSTASLIANALKNKGEKVTFNSAGSNLSWGITTTLIKDANLNGKIKTKYLVLEIDERYAKNVLANINPDYLIITNLTKDQPPRNFHVDFVLEELISSIPEHSVVITSMDSPFMRKLELMLPNKISYYSLGKNKYSYKNQIFENLNTYYCPKCLARLKYTYYNFESLGAYYCPHCEFAYEDPETIGKNLDLENRTIEIDSELINLSGDMLYDAYNTICAYHTLKLVGLSPKEISTNLNKNHKNNTEASFTAYQKDFKLLYCKCENAPTFNQALFKIKQDKSLKDIIIGWKYITIRYPYHDISWIYDISFELLKNCNVNKIYVLGVSAEDLKTRLELAGLTNIEITNSLEEIKDEVIKSPAQSVYGVLNYDYHEPYPFKETFQEEQKQ